MTADIDDREPGAAEASAPEPEMVPASHAVRWHFLVSAVFIVVSALLLAFNLLKLVWPLLVNESAFFTFGRLLPAATNGFLYGGLMIGLLGAGYYVLPKLGGRQVGSQRAAILSLVLIATGVAGGMAGIVLGYSEGRPYLEFPLYTDALIVIGLFVAAGLFTNAARGDETRLGPPSWYLVTGSWWLALSWVVGNLPGIPGFSSAIQSSFFRASITGMGFVALGIGVVYYLVPKLVGVDPRDSSRLSPLGFWSLAIVWVGTGAKNLIYGAGPDWLETLGVAFSIALLVPVLVIFADLFVVARGRWGEAADPVVIRFVAAGAFLFALVPLMTLVQALRTSSAIVQFTSWVQAYDYLLFFGALSMWLFAISHHVHAGGRRVERVATAIWHLRYSLIGIVVAIAAAGMGGLVAGFTWAGGANEAISTATGEGFFNTASRIEPFTIVTAFAFAVFALAQLLYLSAVVRPPAAEERLPIVDAEDAYDLQFAGESVAVSLNALTYGGVVVFAAAALLFWLLPSLDPVNSEGTIRGDTVRIYPEDSALAQGRQIYLREGCWYCHTQEVRGIVTDVELGPVSVAGDYVHEVPILRGVQRFGPDLMHAGSREPISSFRWTYGHLSNPQFNRPWSNMPAYAYLSPEELDLLARYVVSLE